MRRDHPLNAGRVLWFRDGGAGGRWGDVTGNGLHGTLTNGPKWAGSRYGGASGLALVSASDQYATLGSPAVFSRIVGTQDFTLAVAFRPAASNTSGQLFNRDSDTLGRGFALDLSGGNLRVFANGGGTPGTTLVTDAVTWPDDQIAFGGSRAGLLWVWRLNLVTGATSSAVGGTATSVPAATCPVLVGRGSYAGFTGPFNGSIWAASAWLRSLPVAEQAADADAFRRGYPPGPDSPLTDPGGW